MSDKTLKIIERLQNRIEALSSDHRDEVAAHDHTTNLYNQLVTENKRLRKELQIAKDQQNGDKESSEGGKA